MDKEYNFDWLVSDIDSTLIFMLKDGKELLGSYQVQELRVNGENHVSVKLANINDLTNFINYGSIRFVDSVKPENIIDIPIKNMQLLLDKGNDMMDEELKAVNLRELGAFSVVDDKIIRDGYAIYVYKIREESEELKEVMKIAHMFDKLSMNEKIEALEEIDLNNYHRNKNNQRNR